VHLVIRNLSKTYPNGTRALKDVSLDVPKGMFGLLGRNGAGKSTLMRIIATLQEPDEGTITLGDLDVLRQKGEVPKTLGYFAPIVRLPPQGKGPLAAGAPRDPERDRGARRQAHPHRLREFGGKNLGSCLTVKPVNGTISACPTSKSSMIRRRRRWPWGRFETDSSPN
jgi:energy-coupling factor transporter ATP-binding protein EcfA2